MAAPFSWIARIALVVQRARQSRRRQTGIVSAFAAETDLPGPGMANVGPERC